MRIIRRLLAISVFAAGIATAAPSITQATTPQSALAGFAYFTDEAQWERLLATPNMKYVVINSYAPGDAEFINKQIDAAHAKGIKVFGYAPAGYAPLGANGITPLTAAQLQFNVSSLYSTYKGLDGLFLDEILGCGYKDPDVPNFYIELKKWMNTNHPGKTMALNPGTALCSLFEPAADIFMVHENAASFYTEKFLPYYAQHDFDWIRALPDSRVWMVAYGVSQADTCNQLQSFASNGAGIITVDDIPGVSTWNLLPETAYMNNMADCSTKALTPVTPATMPPTTTTTLAPTTTKAAVAAVKVTVKKTTKKVVKKITKRR